MGNSKSTFFFVMDVAIPKMLSCIIVVCQIAFTAIIGASVVFRFLNIDLYGNEEFVLIFAFWLYLMGGAYGSYERSHIQADIVKELMKDGKLKSTLLYIANIVQLVTCLVLAYWSLNYFVWGIIRKATSIAWRIPMVIPQSALFLGFSIMLVYAVMDFVSGTKKIFSARRAGS